jgi:imidazole glycerol-phosphate synthase subunit HisF
MPLTVGGGVRSTGDVRRLLQVGADKVALNTAAVERPELITEVAERFGSQCVVVSIDARRLPGGGHEVFTRSGTAATGRDPVAVARDAAARGAGEILLTSIDRDGTMTGYDVELTRAVCSAVDVPVIASGGAGTYQHMAEVIRASGCSAVAAASMFHFSEQTPLEAKRYLQAQGLPVRM